MNVLFVDDEADIRELIELAIMTEPDIEATFAASGTEAMSLLATQTFDVMLLDVMMPPPDGLDVLRAARANADQGDAIIVMCTARTSAESEAEFRALGADHILHKPFKPLKLAEYIRSLT
ncbi:two-component response regulator [Pseudooceanicola batsensis HTCC2597]|uniref:Two-component response regulator n=1 Tax=Pseudooceanicola batsensis (strain ATCC BAA-863 / DSM 15984 / KCTC 12145 / HTCC2597) TaxID=252305 RepID=A3U0W2_PSEBH|nr:response regulator [Pseudooceanicola batsensis]EAQ02403.1 two-component response regulator [Pseudooceanicola batsensis HTCC2597]